jgi:hypothetical protein
MPEWLGGHYSPHIVRWTVFRKPKPVEVIKWGVSRELPRDSRSRALQHIHSSRSEKCDRHQ